MRIIIILFFFVVACFATDYTTAQTGDWNSSSTWTPTGIPATGDTATIANGHTLTVPSGYTAVIGTSPADDTGTVALRCSSGTGTGVLVVAGSLRFQGPVNQCNSTWTIQPGATITHDSSLAATPSTANYAWRFTGAASQTGALLYAVGSLGSPITFNKYAGSGDAGGFRPTTDTSTDGNVNIQNATISDWSTASGYLVRIYPNTCSTTAVRGLILRNVKISNSGEIYVANSLGSCTVDISNVVITGAKSSYAISIGRYSPLNTAIATNGMRRLNHVYVEGGSVYIVAHAGNIWDLGLDLYDLYLRGSTANTFAPFLRGGQLQVGASGRADLIVLDNRIQSSNDSGSIPAGTVTRLMTWRNYNANAHFSYTTPLATTVDGWQAWNSVSDTAAAGDVFMVVTTGSANHAVTIKNGIMLRQPDGAASGTTVNYNGATACSGTNCPQMAVENNTFYTANVGATGAIAVTQESNNGYAGIYPSVINNLVHQQSSAVGWVTKWSSSLAVVANQFTTVDYNWSHNVSGDRYFTETANGEYASAPGAHDASGDPLFVDIYRTPVTFAQRYDAAVTTSADVAAKFLACYQRMADGTTACDSRFNLADMYNWIRAGWRTRNKATWTAGSGGTYVGGVAPMTTFGAFSNAL